MANRRWALGRRRKNPLVRLFFVLLVCSILSAATLLYLDYNVRPYIRSMSETRAQALATYAVTHAVNEEMQSKGIDYHDLITLDKTPDGKINALQTDIVKLNRLKASLAEKIQVYLTDMDQAILSVPLGNIINGEILSGRGPRIHFKMIPIGSVQTDIENIFTSAGINQTRHQIMMKVTVQISVLLPITSARVTTDTSFCIAETVIVGAVPENYTNVNGDDSSTIGKINDYGTNGDS